MGISLDRLHLQGAGANAVGKILGALDKYGQVKWGTPAEFDIATITAMQAYVAANAAVPIGAFMPFDGVAPAAGAPFILCRGGTVLGTDYPDLATAWGTGGSSRYGAAAAGLIKLPDLRGRTVFAADQGTARRVDTPNAGQAGGAEKHSLTTAEMVHGTYYTASSGYVRTEVGPNPGVAYGPFDRTGGTPGTNGDAFSMMPPHITVADWIVRGK